MAQRLCALTLAARFEAALGQRPCAKSTHFSIHFVREPMLSTGGHDDGSRAVDDLSPAVATSGRGRVELGLVVPKRHARRSVTRNLVKRQARERFRACLPDLVSGAWVLRLRAPLDRRAFPSAASAALSQALRDEIGTLLRDALRRVAPRAMTGG